MRGIVASLPFALLTVVCWGSYGPVLHHGKTGMDNNSWAQLLCVGISYFVVAVLVPLYVLWTKSEQGEWSVGGVKWGLAAGALGAFGALGIITALTNGGSPSYVMPIVFGCAPVVNTFVSMYMAKLFKEVTPSFYLGIILVALGACGVFAFKPTAVTKTTTQLQPEITTVRYDEKLTAATNLATESETSAGETSETTTDESPSTIDSKEKKTNIMLIVGGICLTVLSWGAYGSILHKSQALMKGSRLRPLLCVGISYFVLAVIIPILIMSNSGFPAQTTTSGWTFSLLAGVCGSVGALGIILSFTFGGKPVFVMPLVFGGAPIINTMISVMEMEAVSDVSPYFFASLTIVIVGAIVTLVSAPKPGKKKPSSEEDKPLWDQTREENAANLEAVNSEDKPANEVEEEIVATEDVSAGDADAEEDPTDDEPVEEDPAADQPADNEPAEEDPAADEPVAEETVESTEVSSEQADGEEDISGPEDDSDES